MTSLGREVQGTGGERTIAAPAPEHQGEKGEPRPVTPGPGRSGPPAARGPG